MLVVGEFLGDFISPAGDPLSHANVVETYKAARRRVGVVDESRKGLPVSPSNSHIEARVQSAPEKSYMASQRHGIALEIEIRLTGLRITLFLTRLLWLPRLLVRLWRGHHDGSRTPYCGDGASLERKWIAVSTGQPLKPTEGSRGGGSQIV